MKTTIRKSKNDEGGEVGCLRDQFMMITEEKRRWQSAANWLLILNGWHFCHHHSSWLSSSHKMRKMRQARNKEIPTQDDSPFLTSDSFVRQLSNSHKAWGNCVKRKLTQCSGLNGHTICIIQEGDFQKNQNGTTRGEICHCHHCRWQCKNFASGVNFSKNTHFFVFLSLKLLKFSEIKGVKSLALISGGVKFLTNLTSDRDIFWNPQMG